MTDPTPPEQVATPPPVEELLAQRLNMISTFVDQATSNYRDRPEQRQRMLLVFTAVLGGLTLDLHTILTPDLTEQATADIQEAADSAQIILEKETHATATRLLVGIWGTGATEGVTAEMWRSAAPGLASACLQIARLTGHQASWDHKT